MGLPSHPWELFLSAFNDEQAKKSGAQKWFPEKLCSAISNGDFFALLFFAFLLVAAEGRARHPAFVRQNELIRVD